MSCYSPELVLRTKHIDRAIFSRNQRQFSFSSEKDCFTDQFQRCAVKTTLSFAQRNIYFTAGKKKTKPNRTKKEKYRGEVREKEQSLFDTHLHVRFSYLIIKERTEIVKNLLKPKYCCIQPSKKGFTVNAVIAILS